MNSEDLTPEKFFTQIIFNIKISQSAVYWDLSRLSLSLYVLKIHRSPSNVALLVRNSEAMAVYHMFDLSIHLLRLRVHVMNKSVCHNMYNIFYKKGYLIFTTTNHYKGHLAVVQHNSNFATVSRRLLSGV